MNIKLKEIEVDEVEDDAQSDVSDTTPISLGDHANSLEKEVEKIKEDSEPKIKEEDIFEKLDPIALPTFEGTTVKDPNQVLEHSDPEKYEYYHSENTLALKDYYMKLDADEPEEYPESHLMYDRKNGGNIDQLNSKRNSSSEEGELPEEKILFESRFESGNIDKVYRAVSQENTFVMMMRYDTNTSRHTQWFNFSVKGLKKFETYTFLFVNNTRRMTSLFNNGLRPLMYSVKDNQGWRRTGKDICYYETKTTMPQKEHKHTFMSLGFKFTPENDGDTYYFSQLYPYTYTQLQHDLKEFEENAAANKSIFLERSVLTKTCGGLNCDLLKLTSSENMSQMDSKKVILLSARVHPGEVQASYMMKGTLEYLLTDKAKDLRETYIFYIVPMLNPDGVYAGNQRCNLHGLDLNRQWKDPEEDKTPTIYKWKEFIRKIQTPDPEKVAIYIDYHGHSRKKNTFIYGCNSTKFRKKKLNMRVYPLILCEHSNSLLCFKDCQFNLYKSKSTTARIVAHKDLGITNSYTCESSLCGPEDNNMGAIGIEGMLPYSESRAHYRTQNYKACGQFMMTAIREYEDQELVRSTFEKLEILFPPKKKSKKILTKKQKNQKLLKRFAGKQNAEFENSNVVVHMPEPQLTVKTRESTTEQNSNQKEEIKQFMEYYQYFFIFSLLVVFYFSQKWA